MILGLCILTLCCELHAVLQLERYAQRPMCHVLGPRSVTNSDVRSTHKHVESRFKSVYPALIQSFKRSTTELKLRRCCIEVDNRPSRVELPGPRQAGQRSDAMLYLVLLKSTIYIV